MERAVARSRRFAIATILVAVGVLALKLWAANLTQSLALWADALESIVNVATAAIALAAIDVSSRPPDRHHQYGHHKAEYLAVVIEGVLITLAAIAIVRAAVAAWFSPPTLDLGPLGIGLSIIALLINAGWSVVLIREGRRNRSPALVADGWHLVSDVLSSAAVLVGLGVVLVTGWTRIDLVIAVLVAAYILWTGARLLKSSMSGLMDEAVEAEVATRIRAVIADNADGALQVHDIRTRIAGRITFIEFHLVVPGPMRVKAAHDICDGLEKALDDAIPGSQVLIHVEPDGEAHDGGDFVL